MKVLNEYPGCHHYWNNFEKSEYYCPNCGTKEVWQEQGSGDYYLGEEWLCTNCNHGWTMQGPYTVKEINVMGKLAQLRSGKTFEPTTKMGR